MPISSASPRYGLSLGDGLSLARVLLTPEAMLDGRRIEEFFSQRFFSTEFWLLWSTIMGSLPQHSAIEFRRYMIRFLYLFGDLWDMTGVMRTPINQHQAFIEPLVAWLRPRGGNKATVDQPPWLKLFYEESDSNERLRVSNWIVQRLYHYAIKETVEF
jgi:myosin-crossreactive antigen